MRSLCRPEPALLPWSSRWSSSSSLDLDEEETRKFAGAAKTWWDPSNCKGAGLLHALHPVRARYISEVVAPQITRPVRKTPFTSPGRPLAGLRALDVGCGGGLLAESLARLGAEVVGMEPTPAAAQAAARHSAADPSVAGAVEYRCGTIYSMFGDEEKETKRRLFDLVCCLEVVEHVPEPARFVAACATLVRPGGALVMSTLNRTGKSWAMSIAGAEHLARALPVGTHQWAKFRAPEELMAAMRAEMMVQESRLLGSFSEVRECGLSGIVYRPEWLYPPFSPLAWDLSKTDTDVSYIAYAIREANTHGGETCAAIQAGSARVGPADQDKRKKKKCGIC